MTTENLYQNQDFDNINPIKPDETESPNTKYKKNFGFTIPNDPKIRLLIILGAVVFILLIISLIVSLFRKGPIAPRRTTPTPTVYVTPIPTENIDISRMPDELRSKFNQVNSGLDVSVEFNPPQIDPEIGAN